MKDDLSKVAESISDSPLPEKKLVRIKTELDLRKSPEPGEGLTIEE